MVILATRGSELLRQGHNPWKFGLYKNELTQNNKINK